MAAVVAQVVPSKGAEQSAEFVPVQLDGRTAESSAAAAFPLLPPSTMEVARTGEVQRDQRVAQDLPEIPVQPAAFPLLASTPVERLSAPAGEGAELPGKGLEPSQEAVSSTSPAIALLASPSADRPAPAAADEPSRDLDQTAATAFPLIVPVASGELVAGNSRTERQDAVEEAAEPSRPFPLTVAASAPVLETPAAARTDSANRATRAAIRPASIGAGGDTFDAPQRWSNVLAASETCAPDALYIARFEQSLMLSRAAESPFDGMAFASLDNRMAGMPLAGWRGSVQSDAMAPGPLGMSSNWPAGRSGAYRVTYGAVVPGGFMQANLRQTAEEPDRRPPEPSSSSALNSATAGSLDLSTVERIRLRAVGVPDLTGEYVVDSDGQMSLPVVGRINVNNVTTASLEQSLSDRFTRLARRDVSVSIEVVRFRPFYIMGLVSQPGAREWQPGLNIVHAIALAGGAMRPDAQARQLATGGPSNVEQVRVQLRFALAQLARLKAERDGSKSLTLPKELSDLTELASVHDEPTEALVARQNAILANQRALMKSQIEGLEHERQAAIGEVEAAEAQIVTMTEQAQIAQSFLKDIETLKNKNVVSNSRYLQQRLETLGSASRLADLKTGAERARARIVAINNQIDRIRQERQSVVSEQIENLERDVSIMKAGVRDPAGLGQRPLDGGSIAYQIARNSGDGVKTMTASALTDVKPGDVVIVLGGAGLPDQTQDAQLSVERAIAASARTSPVLAVNRPADSGLTLTSAP
jgi:exopolysaccharide production protein ExoF